MTFSKLLLAPVIISALIVTVGLPGDAARLLTKVQASFLTADNMVQAAALLEQTPEGQPMPYQPWLGVSKADYEQALAATPVLTTVRR